MKKPSKYNVPYCERSSVDGRFARKIALFIKFM